mmetsp:Transcript_41823/g.104597  ORF Transcript_41823/g.104597 Transcript_41823/m.104597 type:complete len:257 (-) Transcript_41823:637-1407(-)
MPTVALVALVLFPPGVHIGGSPGRGFSGSTIFPPTFLRVLSSPIHFSAASPLSSASLVRLSAISFISLAALVLCAARAPATPHRYDAIRAVALADMFLASSSMAWALRCLFHPLWTMPSPTASDSSAFCLSLVTLFISSIALFSRLAAYSLSCPIVMLVLPTHTGGGGVGGGGLASTISMDELPSVVFPSTVTLPPVVSFVPSNSISESATCIAPGRDTASNTPPAARATLARLCGDTTRAPAGSRCPGLKVRTAT